MSESAWAAGFFDGEGTTSFSPVAKATRIQISQKDPELLYRFAAAVGIGVVRGPYRNGKGFVYQYRVSNKADVIRVIAMLWPFLGRAKRKQAISARVGAVPGSSLQGGAAASSHGS